MRALILALTIAAGCTYVTVSPPMDAGTDATTGVDSGTDSGAADAGQDAGLDSGPACECSAGPCCDGCHFRPVSYVCQDIISSGCVSPSLCQNQERFAQVSHNIMRCSGADSACVGAQETTNDSTDCRNPTPNAWLQYGRCDPTGVAHCVDGPSCIAVFP